MSLGEVSETTSIVKSWPRSWRQELFTDGGTDFRMRAHMEIVTMVDGFGAMSKQEGVVERRMSQVGNDTRVIQMAHIMEELIKEWYDEDRKTLQVELSQNVAGAEILPDTLI